MTRSTVRLEVDQLGDRILPSVRVLAPPVTPTKAVVAPTITLTSLSGSGQGTFVPAPTPFGVGPVYGLRATGTIKSMGSVTVTGSLHTPALTATGPVTGQLVLSTAQGSITVSLTAPSQSGRSALPTSYQYKIVASSGEFAGSSAQGTMHLTLTRSRSGAATLSFSF